MLFECVALVVPDITGGAHGIMWGAVFVLEMVCFINAYWAVVVLGGRGDGEAARLLVE